MQLITKTWKPYSKDNHSYCTACQGFYRAPQHMCISCSAQIISGYCTACQGFYRAPQHMCISCSAQIISGYCTACQGFYRAPQHMCISCSAHVYSAQIISGYCELEVPCRVAQIVRLANQIHHPCCMHDLGQSQLLQKTWDLQFSLYCTASSQALPDPLQNKGEPGKSDLAGCGQLIPDHAQPRD